MSRYRRVVPNLLRERHRNQWHRLSSAFNAARGGTPLSVAGAHELPDTRAGKGSLAGSAGAGLGQVCRRFNWVCHAWCQMSNHYHLLLETPEANLAAGMRQLNGVYTRRFNRAHGRVGHVFQGRYSEAFVKTMQAKIENAPALDEIPRAQRRAP